MIIESIEIKKLYGAINIKKTFHSGINLLVGINGSGKTSTLNVISWLMRPALEDLATTEFEELTLRLKKADDLIVINVKQTEKTIQVHLTVNDVKYFPLHIDLRYSTANLRENNHQLGEAKKLYASLAPSKDEMDTLIFFKNMTKPTVISLDRNIAIQMQNSYAYERGLKNNGRSEQSQISPLTQVSEITRIQYIKYKNAIISLNEELKGKILLSSFESEGFQITKTKNSKLPKLDEVEKIEIKVLQHLPQWIKGDEAHKKVQSYFKRLKQVVSKITEIEKTSVFFVGGMYKKELTRLTDITSAFNHYESSSKVHFDSLSKYLITVNDFFKDSGKQISFNEKTNALQFHFTTSDKKPYGEPKNIEQLSSGERQILILMTYVSFPPDVGSILIIDEPELSLHPKWQRDFLSSVNALMPAGHQIILATHSPEIVGRNKDKCIVINAIDN